MAHTTVRGVILGRTHASDIRIEDGRIVAIAPAARHQAEAGSSTSLIAPTVFDIQVNGVGGINLQSGRVTPEDVYKVSDWLARRGVSHWVPTLITGPQSDMEHGCRVLAESRRDPELARAVPGIHLEGPFISPVDGPRGAHPKQHVRPPDLREFDRLMRAAAGKVLYITVAPEVAGAIPFIKAVVKRGVIVALGHHHGSADDIARAADAGARLCTHLGNGLASMINRHVNPLWPQLADDRLTASLIADLEHLPAPALKSFVRAKGSERIILTSDCVHVAGLKPGKYRLAGHDVELTRKGRINLVGTDLLAGSALMLLQGIVNAVQVANLTLEQAFACATTNPARLFGVKNAFHAPAIGQNAEFIAFEMDKSKIAWKAVVRAVFINGQRRN